MEYKNESVRRQDRLLERERAMELLREAEYGVLSMQNENGEGAYGIPVSFVWDRGNSIYLHCAPAGRKLDCIRKCNKVSFCIVGHTHVVPDKFTTEYESVVLRCEAHISLHEAERMSALSLLVSKYAPAHKAVGMDYAGKSFHRTEIIRLDIQEFSGKCKHMRGGNQ